MNVDDICDKILAEPKETRLDQDGIIHFLKAGADLLMKEKNVIHLSGKALFVGDLHGDIDSTISALNLAEKEGVTAVFLGDIVDRGNAQIETVNLLLAKKLKNPDGIIILRGNHEFKEVNMRFGFADAVMEIYPQTVYWLYNVTFSCMPFAVVLNERVLGIHGGLSGTMDLLADLDNLSGSVLHAYDERFGFIWNDPNESHIGFEKNGKRGVFYTYGRDVFDAFMERNNLDLLVRGHEVWEDGYKYFFDKRLISVFSSTQDISPAKPSAVLLKQDGSHEILAL